MIEIAGDDLPSSPITPAQHRPFLRRNLNSSAGSSASSTRFCFCDEQYSFHDSTVGDYPGSQPNAEARFDEVKLERTGLEILASEATKLERDTSAGRDHAEPGPQCVELWNEMATDGKRGILEAAISQYVPFAAFADKVSDDLPKLSKDIRAVLYQPHSVPGGLLQMWHKAANHESSDPMGDEDTTESESDVTPGKRPKPVKLRKSNKSARNESSDSLPSLGDLPVPEVGKST
jgi:hypothetical protein